MLETSLGGVSVRASVADWTGRAIFAAVLALYALYAWYLAAHLPPFPSEAVYGEGQGSWLFSTVRRLWASLFGGGLIAARGLSVLLALCGIALAYRIGAVMGRDRLSGAFLALGFILFPPLAGILSLATPHALVNALVLAAIAVTVDPKIPRRRFYKMLAAGVLLALAVGAGVDTVSEPAPGSPSQGTVWGAVLLPYAMVWVGALLALPASFSPHVAARLGSSLPAVRLALALFAASLGTMAVLGGWDASHLLAGAAYVISAGLLGVLPLILWVRFAMPRVRSMIAWLAFPVIMYSGFWVVLGPIGPNTFPYSHLSQVAG